MVLRRLVGCGGVAGLLVALSVGSCADHDGKRASRPADSSSGAAGEQGAAGNGAAGDVGMGAAAGVDAGGASGEAATGPVKLLGSVQKGPFITGSNVDVFTVDSLGETTGQVFRTSTSDDLGNFSLSLDYQGGASIESDGYYYNELTGRLSASNLSLRSLTNIGSSASQGTYLNVLTHLTYGRIKRLLAEAQETSTEPTTGIPPQLIAEAESELHAALGLGGPQFDPGVSHADMNVLGADNDADAYVLAASVILIEMANRQKGSGTIEASLQQLLNTLSAHFQTGELPSWVAEGFAAIQQDPSFDIDWITKLFQERLRAVQADTALPDLRRVWDSDGDGVVDREDNCPRIGNPDQQPVNDTCGVRRAWSDMQGTPFVADFDNDGKPDICIIDASDPGEGNVSLYRGNGDRSFAAPIETTITVPPNAGGSLGQGILDIDGDGNVDLLGRYVLWGDGEGHFSEPDPAIDDYFDFAAALDVNRDGKRDIIYSDYDGVTLKLGNADRTFGEPITVLQGGSRVWHMSGLDIDDDGFDDVVLTARDRIWILWGNGAAEAPYFTVGSPLLSEGQFVSAEIVDLIGSDSPDLVVTSISDSGDFQVLEGNGTRAFGAPLSLQIAPPGEPVRSLQYVDLNGDGRLDVLDDSLHFALSEGNGLVAGTSIRAPDQTSVGGPGAFPHWQSSVATDLDGDGVPELLAVYGVNGRSSNIAIQSLR